jgi:hypothetical protein
MEFFYLHSARGVYLGKCETTAEELRAEFHCLIEPNNVVHIFGARL